MRTGIQWKALPAEQFGATSAVHRYVMAWTQYNELNGIDRAWLSIDGYMTKAPLAKETIGHNQTARGKNGSKRHLLVNVKGVPAVLVITGNQTLNVS